MKQQRSWRLRWFARVGILASATAIMSSSCGGTATLGSSVTTVASASSATVSVKTVKGLGKILVTGDGRVLYLLTSDPSGSSNCIGSCAIVWPPLEVKGRLKAGPGVDPKLLSTIKRRQGGGTQVLYDKHALYTYAQDTGPGMATGQGVQTYGGTWWVVSPTGRAVTH